MAIAWLPEGEFQTQTLEIDGKEVKAQIWDTAGQERFHVVTSTYYRGAFGALVVYDITRRSTFGSIPRWLDELKKRERNFRLLVHDGKLRVFKWPSMEIILNEASHPSVKDLNFRALVSTSMDSSSRVTSIKDKKKDGMNLWIILLIIILAVSVYYAKTKELIPL
ncbi:hypothetical protein ACS0TY_011404 [Phlomoides rotata]